MKIGVVASSFDMLALFTVLNKFDHEYVVYWDWNNGAYGDKDITSNLENIQDGIDILKSQGVEKIIVPPVYELSLDDEIIFPLFQNYLLKSCIPSSLVGKIGFVGDWVDMDVIENLFKILTKNYSLTPNQKNTKIFKFPFAVWKKETRLWKEYLKKFGFRDWMVNRTIRDDLRYFKDAAVDTVVPLNWGYLAYEKSIKAKLNLRKIKFHGKDKLEEQLIGLGIKDNQSSYGVKIIANGNIEMLLTEKKWMWILERGKSVKVEII